MFCPQCGNENDSSAQYCAHCGHSLTQVAEETPVTSTTAAAADNQEELYKAIIGPKKQEYYLRHFSRFDADGKIGISWHWPAFFVSFWWFLYRKMWLYAVIYFLLPYLAMIPLTIVIVMAGEHAEAVSNVVSILFFACICLLPPLYANALYYRHCKNKIAEVQTSSHDRQRQLGELAGRGGTSVGVLAVIFIFVFIVMIGILAAIAVPAYVDYTTRARVDGAATAGTNITNSVADYYQQHQQMPSTLAQAGFAGSLPQSVKGIEIDSQTGVVTVTMAESPIEGKTLLLVPSFDSNGQITWKCMSQEIQDRLLPPRCRQQ